tara:strand:- start:25 stop:921 length:897 start_codon:yes stop_codon:yes gene_type:complete
MILDPTDQNIRDQGFNFVPFDRYLAAPFQPSNISFDTNTGAGIPTALPRRTMPTGGEGIGPGVNLGQDARGYLGDFETFDFNERYSNPTIPTAQRDYDIYGNKLQEFTPQSPFSRAIGNVVGKGIDLGKTVGSGILSAAVGIPFAGPVISKGLEAFSNQFTDRQLGAPVIDEFGNVYDEEELNRQNALGGYYSEAARSSRRRTSRINNMLERLSLGKKISFKNLAELQAQEKAQEAARQAAFEAAMAQGRGFYDTLNEGRGASVSDKSREEAGTGFDSLDEGSPFASGGIVDLVDIYD